MQSADVGQEDAQRRRVKRTDNGRPSSNTRCSIRSQVQNADGRTTAHEHLGHTRRPKAYVTSPAQPFTSTENLLTANRNYLYRQRAMFIVTAASCPCFAPPSTAQHLWPVRSRMGTSVSLLPLARYLLAALASPVSSQSDSAVLAISVASGLHLATGFDRVA